MLPPDPDLPPPAEAPRRETPGLALGFVLAGILVVVYAAWEHPILQIPLTAQFGLLELLPPSYWLGMGLMGVGVALGARSRSDLLFVVAGAALLGIFAVTPGLFELNPPVSDAYYHFWIAQQISATGHLPTDPTQYAANWPGFYLVVSFANLLGQPPPVEFIRLFPFFSGLLTFVCLFAFLRAFFSPAIARPASILCTFLDVWAQFHVSPEGVGLALALLVLATAWERRVPLRVANTVLFLGLVVSHATTAIFLLMFFGLDALFASAVPRRRPRPVPPSSTFVPAFNPFLAYAAVWLGWLFFIASGSAEVARTAVVTQIGKILNLGGKAASVAASRSVENIYPIPPLLRLGALAFFGILGMVALLALVRRQEERGRARFLFSAILGLGILGAADILFLGGLFSDRSFMFFAVIVPGLCLYALQPRARPRTHARRIVRPAQDWTPVRRTVVVFLLIVSFLAASTTYYQAAFDFTPPQAMVVSDFLSTHAGSVYVLDGIFPQPVWLISQPTQSLAGAPFYSVYPATLKDFARSTPAFAVYDQVSRLWYVQGKGLYIYTYYEDQQANYSLVYDNAFSQVYLLYRPVASG